MQLDSNAIDRFWSKVSKSDSCWIWTGAKSEKGYGIFYVQGKYRKAQQIAYTVSIGPIPAGLQLDHLCRTPACVNPSHLDPVTSRENTLRGIAARPDKRSGRKTLKELCKHGHPYSGENLYLTPRGRRMCRACMSLVAKRFKERPDYRDRLRVSRDKYLKKKRLKKLETQIEKLRRELGLC